MDFKIIPDQELQELKEDIKTIKDALIRKSENDLAASYIESKNIPILLGISVKTWQSYRDKKIIPFIQFGSKIWVKRADIDAFLDAHYISRNTTNKGGKNA